MHRKLSKRLRKAFNGKLVFLDDYLNKYHVFNDRHHAGEVLTDLINSIFSANEIFIMAIPCGGVPVGYTVSKRLKIPLDLLVCRKILIPWNREAGYGAVAPDGSVVLNERLLDFLKFSEDEVKEHINETLNEIERRIKLFRGIEEYKAIKSSVVVIDDGIASGYTMLAAVKFLKKLKGIREIIIGTPTAPPSAILLLILHVNLIICPNVRTEVYGFAVADAYKEWHDVSDEEVLRYIQELSDLYVPNKLKRDFILKGSSSL